ncbi:hypothetical protein PILCRDRAFT_89691 [Piloderma croceum F 1598]|uniref:Uncharacterized protein n=1 Tax=Piloderma croceum (strain F 1598) TaxID=765440 RepID=A0A0C3BSX1_PILCF|nr:hypothetical protein PILCRDRAFT_89691 [Piloderma croceum F 1598]
MLSSQPQKKRRLKNSTVIAFADPAHLTWEAPMIPIASSLRHKSPNNNMGVFSDSLSTNLTQQVGLAMSSVHRSMASSGPDLNRMQQSLADLEAASHAFWLAQAESNQKKKGMGATYDRHVCCYNDFWDQYQAELCLGNPQRVSIPSFPIMAAKYEGQDYQSVNYAQPHSDFNLVIHPSSVAAQLGLMREEIQEVLEDQKEWMREQEEQEQGEDGHTMAEKTHQQQRGRDDEMDARTAPPLLEYTHGMVHDAMHDYDVPTVPFEHRDESDDGAVCVEPDHSAIEPLVHEPVAPGNEYGDWSEDLNREMAFNLQDPPYPLHTTTPLVLPPLPPATVNATFFRNTRRSCDRDATQWFSCNSHPATYPPRSEAIKRPPTSPNYHNPTA